MVTKHPLELDVFCYFDPVFMSISSIFVWKLSLALWLLFAGVKHLAPNSCGQTPFMPRGWLGGVIEIETFIYIIILP